MCQKMSDTSGKTRIPQGHSILLLINSSSPNGHIDKKINVADILKSVVFLNG